MIGFVLAPLAEENLSVGLMASEGSGMPLFTEPFTLVCFFIAVIAMFSAVKTSRRGVNYPAQRGLELPRHSTDQSDASWRWVFFA